MDLTPHLELLPAPRAVFDRLDERASRPRFLLPTSQGDGDWEVVTWGGFARRIRRVALHLAAAGLRPGDRACVFGANSVDWLAAALGIQSAGGVMVPIYGSSTAEQAGYVLSHSEARFVFADPALGPRLRGRAGGPGQAEILLLADGRGGAGGGLGWSALQERGAALDEADPLAFERLLAEVSLEQPGLMLYTSGTSGPPKGVPLTHRNVATNGRGWLEANQSLLREGMVDLLWLPMSHIFGLGEACLGNTLGFTTYLADPATVLARMPEVRPDVFMSVPSVWDKLAAQIRERGFAAATGGRLHFCLSGGAGLDRRTKELFHQHGVLILEGYGLTETSPTLTMNRPDAFRFDSVGRPLGGVALRLAEDGEILCRGPNVFAGYHRDPEATRAAFTEDGWFKTGDVGRFTEDGFLQIVDRKKDILVTAGGKNVPPANIEVRFAGDPLIAHVVVYGDGKRYLVAGVWLQAGAAGPEAAERVAARVQAVNAELASWESIKRFAVFSRPLTVEEGFLTPTLKVRRKRVYEAFRAEFEALYG